MVAIKYKKSSSHAKDLIKSHWLSVMNKDLDKESKKYKWEYKVSFFSSMEGNPNFITHNDEEMLRGNDRKSQIKEQFKLPKKFPEKIKISKYDKKVKLIYYPQENNIEFKSTCYSWAIAPKTYYR